jgi:hypothetical protein
MMVMSLHFYQTAIGTVFLYSQKLEVMKMSMLKVVRVPLKHRAQTKVTKDIYRYG